MAIYYLGVAAIVTLFFELWRSLTLLQLREQAGAVPSAVIFQSFLVGIRFDFSVTCYLILPVIVLGMLPFIDISRSKVMRWINNALLFSFTAVAFFVSMADIEFFKFFNSRLNGMALEWSDTPGFVVAMIWETYPVVRYMLLYVIVLAIFIKLILLTQKGLLKPKLQVPFWVNLIWLPVLIAILVLGGRGRIEEKAPLTWGEAYFSEYSFANLLALNPNFTFFRDAFYDAGVKRQAEEMVKSIERPDAEAVTRKLLAFPAEAVGERLHKRIEFDHAPSDTPNVIVILMESFGTTGVGCLQHSFKYDLSPRFDSLAKEGIVDGNFYSAGMHTHNGIVGSLYGYPATAGGNLMKLVGSEDEFWGLPSILKKHGYHTMFFCTHDPQFDNMQGFLKSNSVEEVFSLFDYGTKEKLSTLGVPDHVMFDHAYDIIKAKGKRPFFAAFMTASNHGPWIIPDAPFEHIPETEPLHKELNAYKYSDWSLGHFVRRIQNDPAFANTIIVVTGDHGTLTKVTHDLELTRFEVPLLILDTGRRLPAGLRLNRLGSQVDILPTVMGLLKLNYDDYSFGKDLLDTLKTRGDVTDFALISEGNLVGYLEKNYYLISRIGGKRSLFELPDGTRDLADSLSGLSNEFEARGLSVYQTAYRNLKSSEKEQRQVQR